MKTAWLKGNVIKGSQDGRIIGFPTINLSPAKLRKYKEGVWASFVKVKNKTYKGVLFYGPRLVKNEKKPVLEIYLIDFSGDLYGETIAFLPLHFIRKVEKFRDFVELKTAIEKDVAKTKSLLDATPYL